MWLHNLLNRRHAINVEIKWRFLILFLFQGVVTLVTGGASGLGRGTVERFIKQGGKVIIGDLPSSKGNDLAKELGDSAVFVPLDVGLFLVSS